MMLNARDANSMSNDDEQIPTLDEWLERWEAAVEARQSSISQEEAEKRYYKRYEREPQYGEGR